MLNVGIAETIDEGYSYRKVIHPDCARRDAFLVHLLQQERRAKKNCRSANAE